MNFKKLTLVALTAASLLSISPLSQAYYEREVDYYYFPSVVTYSNAGYTLSKSFVGSEGGKLSKVVGAASLLNNIEYQLYDTLEQKIKDEIGSGLSLKSLNFDLIGPKIIKLSGKNNGTIEARVGGFRVSARAKLEYSFLVDARVDINSDVLWFVGQYNPSTGEISDLREESEFDIDVDVDIDSIIKYLLPGISYFFINNFEDMFEEMAPSISQLLNYKLNSYETTIFGLDDKIPAGQYVINGFDAGQAIQDAFYDLYSGESIELTLERDHSRLDMISHYEDFDIDTLKINISDHLFFEVTERAQFTHQEWIYEGGSTCSRNSGCNGEP